MLFSYLAFPQTSSIEGIVIEQNGNPVKQAEVYCEQGLFSPLLRTLADDNGMFRFTNLKDEPTGVFATADGFSWGGVHINLPPDEQIKGVEIILFSPSKIRGKVCAADDKKKEMPVKGVEITRFAMLGQERVSIPLSKLADFGYMRILSDGEGNFVIDKVPPHILISLKLEHPDFAVASTNGNMSGEEVRILLEKGCLLLGSVYLGEDDVKSKIPGARVMIKSAKPPFETTCVTTDSRGEFTVRMKPGNYLCFAETEKFMTSGWLLKTVANSAGEYLNLPVYPSVNVYGIVRDAVSGEPVRGVRVCAEQGGRKLKIVNTGKSGKFRFRVAKGYLNIRFESIPGYSLPIPSSMNIAVDSSKDLELPGIWVKKLDDIKIAIKGINNISWGYLSIINPYQLGWNRFNRSNLSIPIASLPSEGKVVGWVLVPENDTGAIFSIERDSIGTACEIELLKNASIYMDFIDSKTNNRLLGVVVDCFYVDENGKEYKLFRAISQGEDKLFLKGLPANALLRYKVLDYEGKVVWFSDACKLLPDEKRDLGKVKLDSYPQFTENKSAIDIGKITFQCGDKKDVFNSQFLLLIKSNREEIPYVLEPLEKIGEFLGTRSKVGLIVSEPVDCAEVSIPIMREDLTTVGSTVLIDRGGKIKFETDGLPVILSIYVEG